MYGKLTIAASEIPDTRSDIEAEVQTEEVNMRILGKIGKTRRVQTKTRLTRLGRTKIG
jgi:hypothetical protein